jgi:hypothetical protein
MARLSSAALDTSNRARAWRRVRGGTREIKIIRPNGPWCVPRDRLLLMPGAGDDGSLADLLGSVQAQLGDKARAHARLVVVGIAACLAMPRVDLQRATGRL